MLESQLRDQTPPPKKTYNKNFYDGSGLVLKFMKSMR